VGPRYATMLQNSSLGNAAKHASSTSGVTGRGRARGVREDVLIILQLMNLGGTIEQEE